MKNFLKTPHFCREATAAMGKLPRWTRLLILAQILITSMALFCLTVTLALDARTSVALSDLTLMVTKLPEATQARSQLFNQLITVLQTSSKASSWKVALCITVIASCTVAAVLGHFLPSKRSQPEAPAAD